MDRFPTWRKSCGRGIGAEWNRFELGRQTGHLVRCAVRFVLGLVIAGGVLGTAPANTQEASAQEAKPAVPSSDSPSPAPPRSAREWIMDLESDDINRIEAATRALAEMGPMLAPNIPDLIRILDQDLDKNRRHVLAIIQVVGPVAKDAVPAIRKKLFHEDFHTQYWACRALGAVGPDAAVAAEDLGKLLSNRYAASVRRNAAQALGRIGPGIGRARLELLVDSLRDRNHPVRVDAAMALAELGPAAKLAVPELKAALIDLRRDMRVPTVVALWRITREPDALWPVLVEELEQGGLPWEAAAAFGELGEAAKPAVPKILPLLKSDNSEVRIHALDALGNIGPAARSAEKEVRACLNDSEADVVAAARDALVKIGAEPAEVIPGAGEGKQ